TSRDGGRPRRRGAPGPPARHPRGTVEPHGRPALSVAQLPAARARAPPRGGRPGRPPTVSEPGRGVRVEARLRRDRWGRHRASHVHGRHGPARHVGPQHPGAEGRVAQHDGPLLGRPPPPLSRQLRHRARPLPRAARLVRPDHPVSRRCPLLRADRRARGGVPRGQVRPGLPGVGGRRPRVRAGRPPLPAGGALVQLEDRARPRALRDLRGDDAPLPARPRRAGAPGRPAHPRPAVDEPLRPRRGRLRHAAGPEEADAPLPPAAAGAAIHDLVTLGEVLLRLAIPPPRPIRILYDRRASAFAGLTPEDVDWEPVRQAGLVHLTGITPALGAGPRALAERALREAPVVSFDVNYRARLWKPDEAREVILGFLPRVRYLFAGAEEARTVFGLTGPAEGLIAGLARLAPAATVVLLLGEAGSVALDRTRLYRPTRRHSVQVADPIGARDPYVAGFPWARPPN